MTYLYLDAIHAKNHSGKVPIWMMRQAGRYMKAYQALRKKYSFEDLLYSPDLATQVTLQPIDAFKMDAAILFSDILVVHKAMGMSLGYSDTHGPYFESHIKTLSDLNRLVTPSVDEALHYVKKTIINLKPELKKRNVPLIGFSGAPFTSLVYMMGYKFDHKVGAFKKELYQNQAFVQQLLQRITDTTIDYVKMQIDAGIDAYQCFDTLAHILSYTDYKTFILPYTKQIVDAIKAYSNVPIALFGLGYSLMHPLLQTLQPHAISFDHPIKLCSKPRTLPANIAIQGNLDPYLLYAPKAMLKKRVEQLLTAMSGDPGFIFNLGHGVFKDVDEARVRFVVDLVHSHQS